MGCAVETVLSLLITCHVLMKSDAQSSKPHIIFILADDLGWNDVSYNGMTEIRTPNIDSLASDGITLMNYYTLPSCTPSRSALMTGLHPVQTGLQGTPISQSAPAGLPLHFKILPERLQDLGYSTHIVGKWDLGYFFKNYTPTYRGFDTHYGYWGGAIDYYQRTILDSDKGIKYSNVPEELKNITIARSGIDFRDNMEPVLDQFETYVTDLLTQRTVDVITKHDKTKPMFMYLSHLAVHKGMRNIPDTAPEKHIKQFEYIEDIKRRIFAAKLTALDDSVGSVVDALSTSGLLNNSLIVFSSDNGADINGFFPTGGSNWPLRGQKASYHEGAIRVPACIWSPLFKGTPRLETGLVHIMDWLPTLYTAGGGNVHDLKRIDGLDLWRTLTDGHPSPRTQFLINIDPASHSSAMRKGNFKFVYGSSKDNSPWYGPTGRNSSSGTPIQNCKVQTVLKAFYGPDAPYFVNLVTPVECKGQQPSSPSDCGIYPCLFNLADDPCEYRNIANEFPGKLIEMWNEIESTETVPPIEASKDYNAAPMKYCGFWDNWLDDNPTMANCNQTICNGTNMVIAESLYFINSFVASAFK